MMKTYSLIDSSYKIIGNDDKTQAYSYSHFEDHGRHASSSSCPGIIIDSPPVGQLFGETATVNRLLFYPLNSSNQEQQCRENATCCLSPFVVPHDHPANAAGTGSTTAQNLKSRSPNSGVTTTGTNKNNTIADVAENDCTSDEDPCPVIKTNNTTNKSLGSSLSYCHQEKACKTLNSESLLHQYIQEHEILVPHDHQDAVEICKGAAALCLMKQDMQVGFGSNAYNQRYGLTTSIHECNYYDSSDQEESGDCSDLSNNIYLFKNKYKREGTVMERNQDGTHLRSSPLGEGHKNSIVALMNRNTTQKRQKTMDAPRQQSSSATSNQRTTMSSRSLLPTSLALASDHRHVNKLHAFVRSELLELFQVPFHQYDEDYDDDEEEEQDEYDHDNSCSSAPSSNAKNTTTLLLSRRRTRNTPCKTTRESFKAKTSYASSPRHFPGRVGLRCVYCANVPKKDQQSMPYFYPKGLSDLYRSTCTWQRVHFKNCSYIPSSVKRKYYNLKESDKTRGKTAYWISSGKEVGLIDITFNGKVGITFQPKSGV